MSQATHTTATLEALGGAVGEAAGTSLAGPLDHLGEGVLRASLTLWENPEARVHLLAQMVAAHTSEDEKATMRAFMSTPKSELFKQLGQVLGAEETPDLQQLADLLGVPPENINAAQAQVWGLMTLRYMVRLEPIASLPVEDVVKLVAPTIQRYLVG
ncbi:MULTISPECIES: hypothetical protein [unclassified Streptomyces]|uniref:TetR/AcrR family transcriptional regulator n=1 Tax=unclassified Streptomyces TaxID=2593676 RepID=UPI0036E6B64C